MQICIHMYVYVYIKIKSKSKLQYTHALAVCVHVCMCVRMCGVCGVSASITGNQRVRHASCIVMIEGGEDNVQCL